MDEGWIEIFEYQDSRRMEAWSSTSLRAPKREFHASDYWFFCPIYVCKLFSQSVPPGIGQPHRWTEHLWMILGKQKPLHGHYIHYCILGNEEMSRLTHGVFFCCFFPQLSTSPESNKKSSESSSLSHWFIKNEWEPIEKGGYRIPISIWNGELCFSIQP